jgi:superfamily I DNA and/or RNA helicase
MADLLVLDEASQMNLPEAIMAALPLRADGRIVIVGDPRQMPPIVHHDWAREARRTFTEFKTYQSLYQAFAERDPAPPQIKFAESFRLHADMAEFLRQEIYRLDGIPYHSRKRDQLAETDVPDLFVAAVLRPEHPLVVVVHDEAQSQVLNPYEQGLIEPVLAALADERGLGLDALKGVGVVVPHRKQRAAVQEAVACLTVRDPATGLVRRSAVDTVERFQGGERTAILVSATESDPDYLLAAGEFLLDPRRLTVAISRAKQKLILVAARSVFTLFSADEETFANVQLWKHLLHRTCTVPLWQGERDGHAVEVWGNG